jgi:membrane protein implicated in regulation of membrane protease activity
MQLQLVLFLVLSLLTVLIGEREVRGVPRRVI